MRFAVLQRRTAFPGAAFLTFFLLNAIQVKESVQKGGLFL